jgi:hypothetical protein
MNPRNNMRGLEKRKLYRRRYAEPSSQLKLTVSCNSPPCLQLVISPLLKEFPVVYGTRKFITVLTTVNRKSISLVKTLQSTSLYYIIVSTILILSF